MKYRIIKLINLSFSFLNTDNISDAASIVRLYMDIRGFGPVKEQAVGEVREKVATHAIMQA